jgi:K(+)-stimulated pyrophosphate-energized sodium pump
MGLELVLLCGVLALAYGLWTVRSVLALSAGNPRMQEIAAAIQEGVGAYLNRQYTTIAGVGAVVFILAIIFLGWQVGVGYLIGAALSGAAGYVGMYVSVRANVRTAEAARNNP